MVRYIRILVLDTDQTQRCGHCVAAKPEVEKAATALKGIAKVGAVDMTQYQSLGQPYGVQGFPTFKIFSGGKPSDFNGQRTASAMVDAVLNAVKSQAKARLSGGSSSTNNNAKQQQQQQQQQQKQQHQSGKGNSNTNNPIEQLDDSNFDSVVMNSDDMFLVAFVADYCGHCKNLKPEYLAAAKKLYGTGIRFAQIEAPQNQQLSSRFGIRGFPTIKVFGPGPKSDAKAMEYQGERSAEAIANYATDTFERLGGEVKVEVHELVDQAIFEKTCGKEKKCIIVFLEDILDTTASERSKNIEKIKNAAKKARHMPFLWVSANQQPKMESQYQLTFGFPAVLMLREGPNGEKVGFVHRGKFVEEELNAFVSAPRALTSGISGNWPVINKITPWDGKDAPKLKLEDDGFNVDEFLKNEL